ncbi:MAG: cell division protein SepF [Thermoproteota archaeon]
MPLFGRKKKQEDSSQQKVKEAGTEVKNKQPSAQIYIKASPLNDLSDIDGIKEEVSTGNIVILKITPLARKSFDDTKKAIHELSEFVIGIDGDIARLGEERIVVAPSGVKIWREKTGRGST